ncbi:hypothetical protein JCM10207_007029 [Rhodosporidiobolus poonsookiae]
MASAQDILNLRTQLAAATSAGDAAETLKLLRQLQRDVVPSEELLRETKSGVTVNKLTNDPSSAVAGFAKELVRKWKVAVGLKGQASSGAATSSSSSDLPTSSTAPPKARRPSISVSVKPTATPRKPPTPPQSETKRSPGPAPKPVLVTPLTTSPTTTLKKRTWKSDGVKFDHGPASKKKKTDAALIKDVRASCCELLYDALAVETSVDASVIVQRASAIENAAWEQDPPNADDEDEKLVPSPTYKQKVRTLHLALKKPMNGDLRERILGEELQPDELVKLSALDLASQEEKAVQDQLRSSSLQSAIVKHQYGRGDYREELLWHSNRK